MSESFCSNCGTKLDQNARFCPNCGKNVGLIEGKETICEDCGKPVPHGSSICPNCGCPVTPISPQPAPHTTPKPVRKPESTGKTIFKVILFTVITVLVVIGGFYGYSAWSDQKQIKMQLEQAASLYNSGDYAAALQIYETFGDNPEAEEQANLCRYQIGRAAMLTESWDVAKETFLSISTEDYGDVQQLIAQCDEGIRQKEEEQKRAQCADDPFLKDLESVVQERLQGNLLIPDLNAAIKDSNKLEKYRTAEFYDEKLGDIAGQVCHYFFQQKNSIQYNDGTKHYRNSLQESWCRHNANIAFCLNQLYYDYGFMNDNVAFIRTYIENDSKMTDWQNAVENIGKDILDSITENGKWHDTGYDNSYMTMHNNTNYTISVQFYFESYSEDETQFLGTDMYYVENIPPKKDYTIYKPKPDLLPNGGSFSTVYTDWEVVSIK